VASVVAEFTYGEVGLLEVQNVIADAGAVSSGGKSGACESDVITGHDGYGF
jgi:hypothetical protein